MVLAANAEIRRFVRKRFLSVLWKVSRIKVIEQTFGDLIRGEIEERATVFDAYDTREVREGQVNAMQVDHEGLACTLTDVNQQPDNG